MSHRAVDDAVDHAVELLDTPFSGRTRPADGLRTAVAPAPKHFAVGDQVTHDVYGLGRVIGIEDGIAALVDFGSTRMRILSPYAKMTKL